MSESVHTSVIVLQDHDNVGVASEGAERTCCFNPTCCIGSHLRLPLTWITESVHISLVELLDLELLDPSADLREQVYDHHCVHFLQTTS
jgi:hypothetical protein